MNAVTQVFALVQAIIYLAVFPLEAFLLHRPWAQRFLSTPAEHVAAVMMWAIPTGFRNLLAALGVIFGLVALHTGQVVIGQTLTIAFCLYMVLAGSTMLLADLRGHYPKKGASIPGTLGATLPALVALVAAAL